MGNLVSTVSLLRAWALLGSSSLDAILHSLEMSKLVSVLTKTPRHNTTEVLLLDNIVELAGNDLRGIPGPEEVSLSVPVVLATKLVIGLAVFLRTAPRVSDGDALAFTVVRETSGLAEVVARATGSIVSIDILTNDEP